MCTVHEGNLCPPVAVLMRDAVKQPNSKDVFLFFECRLYFKEGHYFLKRDISHTVRLHKWPCTRKHRLEAQIVLNTALANAVHLID